jgi:hypothetical protein
MGEWVYLAYKYTVIKGFDILFSGIGGCRPYYISIDRHKET